MARYRGSLRWAEYVRRIVTDVRIEGADLDLGNLSALLTQVRDDEHLPGLVAHVVVRDRAAGTTSPRRHAV
jgi:hypothetical protein